MENTCQSPKSPSPQSPESDISADLDVLVGKVKSQVESGQISDLLDEELEQILTKLSVYLYYVSSKSERVNETYQRKHLDNNNLVQNGINGGLADGTFKNKTDARANVELTIADKRKEEIEWQTAYQALQDKVNFASELMMAIKKILSARIATNQKVANGQTGGVSDNEPR